MTKIRASGEADFLHMQEPAHPVYTPFQMFGLEGDDTLWAANGDDVIAGNDGRDKIKGINGEDVIYGGAGGDYLDGGNGNDVLFGGPGEDTFVFDDMGGTVDTIADFRPSDTLWAPDSEHPIAIVSAIMRDLDGDGRSDDVRVLLAGSDPGKGDLQVHILNATLAQVEAAWKLHGEQEWPA